MSLKWLTVCSVLKTGDFTALDKQESRIPALPLLLPAHSVRACRLSWPRFLRLLPPISEICSWLLYCCDKDYDQRELGEERGSVFATLSLSPSWREVRAETCGSRLTGCSRCLLNLLRCATQAPLQGGTAHSGPHNNPSGRRPPDFSHRLCDESIFSVEIPLPRWF